MCGWGGGGGGGVNGSLSNQRLVNVLLTKSNFPPFFLLHYGNEFQCFQSKHVLYLNNAKFI